MPQTFNLASDISSTDPVDLPESLVYPFLWALGPGAEVAGSLPLEGAANEGERQEEALPGLLVMVPGVLTGGGGEAKAVTLSRQRSASTESMPRGSRPANPENTSSRFCLDFALICCARQKQDFEIQRQAEALIGFWEGLDH